jgi:hypothetical protein
MTFYIPIPVMIGLTTVLGVNMARNYTSLRPDLCFEFCALRLSGRGMFIYPFIMETPAGDYRSSHLDCSEVDCFTCELALGSFTVFLTDKCSWEFHSGYNFSFLHGKAPIVSFTLGLLSPTANLHRHAFFSFL